MNTVQRGVALRVVIDMFSGRPNPHWEMTGDEAGQFIARLRNLSAGRPEIAAQATPPGLGFRGIVVRKLRGDESVPEEVRIFNSILTITRAGSTSYHEDNAKIQEFFLDQAKAKGHAALIEKISPAQRPSAR